MPYKNESGTLIFPTGKFKGVYFSEELKYAKTLGYEIIPLRGFLFEEKPSPFIGIIEDLYSSRLEAKKKGDEAMSFIYKLLMNSLYGRFGINPESTITEICKNDRCQVLMKKSTFESMEPINDIYFLVKYKSNSSEDENWKAPKMAAVHLSAAITACARIHMYKHISRADCYYTDTDSVVLGSPLPEDFISSKELGLFKLEYQVMKGIFLSPKSYMLQCEGETTVMKHKGIAKDEVTEEWFESIYANPTLVKEMTKGNPFSRDWKNLQIYNKEINLRLGAPTSDKRVKVFNENDLWVDTKPHDILEIGCVDANIIMQYELSKEEGVSASKSTTEQKTYTQEEEGKSTTEQNTYTQESTLFPSKPNKKTIRKAKAKKDNSSPGVPKPDE